MKKLILIVLALPMLVMANHTTSNPFKYAEKDAKWEATRAPTGYFYKCYDKEDEDEFRRVDCLVVANGGHPELPTVLTVRVKYYFKSVGSGRYKLDDKDYESIE